MTEKYVFCPFCGSNNVAMVTEEVGLCRSCLEKVTVIKKKPFEPFCYHCGSENIELITDKVGICKDCLEKVDFRDDFAKGVSTEETKEEDVIAIEENETSDDFSSGANDLFEDGSSIDIDTISCPSCGSNHVEILSDEMAFCEHCESNIVINKQKGTVKVVNEVHIHTNSSSPSDLITSYAVKPEIDANEFTRKALITLAKEKNTPIDIFESEFFPVSEGFRHFTEVICDVNISYSANIGTDRKEEYTEYNSYQKKYERKTRTVTDWAPITGLYTGTEKSYQSLDNKGLDGFDYTCKTLKASLVRAEDATFKTEAPILPTQGDIESRKNDCINAGKGTARYNLKGDHVKDFSASGVGTVTSVKTYVLKQYRMKYKYEGKEQEIRSFASGVNYDWGNFPNVEKEILSEVDQKCHVITLVSAALLLLSIILSLAVRSYAVVIITFLAAAGLFIASEIYRYLTKKNLYAENSWIKLESLQVLFSKKHLKPLSDKEMTEIIGGKK